MATKANAPCKGCPDRTTGDRAVDCHTTCERYAAFKERNAAINKARCEYLQGIGAEIVGRRRLKENPPTGANKRPWTR